MVFSKNNKKEKYIENYIKLNSELFPFLDIEKLSERVKKNFTKVSPHILSFLYNDYGQYDLATGKILLAPKLYYGKNKKYKESVIYHELDHGACTPMGIRQQYSKYKIKYKLVPDFILSEIFALNYEGKLITGIDEIAAHDENKIQKIITKSNWKKHLNEGITEIKQILYSEKLKIEFHKEKDFYVGARMGAECVANVIGFEEMIKHHFENNLEQIEKEFNDRVSIKIKDLMNECLMYDNHRKRTRLDKLKGKITQIYQELSK